jgi:transposase
MARPKEDLILSDEAEKVLKKIVSGKTSSVRAVLRAKIVLLGGQGRSNAEISTILGVSRVTVGLWRQRFLEQGLIGLNDAPGRGRSSWVDPKKAGTIIDESVRPPKARSRWSCRSMASHIGVSSATVQRIWAKNDLKPHLIKTFKLSNDKDFERKFWDIIGIYLNPPDRAVVLCCDEKSQCQALERTQKSLPLTKGHPTTRTHDYKRHGTVTLFAALNYLEGKIIARTAERHRHQEWLTFLKTIDKEIASDIEVHIILDNYGTHKHPKVKAWIKRHPRFHLHFTPTSSSWMNMVERFFRDLTEDVIRSGSFASVKDLVASIFDYLTERNLNPKRYVWKAEGEKILAKIAKARQNLAHVS